MNDLVKYRNEYDKLIKEGHLNKELNLSYKKKIFEHEESLKKAYLVLNIRKNKFVCDTCTVELYMREIKEPLTIERLGKYFYKFFYTNKVNNNDKDDPESKKKISNLLATSMIKFIEKERYVDDKLSIRVIKNNKKDTDYSDFSLEKIK